MSTILDIKTLIKSFDPKEGNVIDRLDLQIAKGSVVSILGESGSGKSTLARLISGLEVPTSGELVLDGTIVANTSRFIPPQKREVGMVFQDYALFPHMTVLENVSYGISSQPNKENRVREVLNLVGLQDLGHRYPHQLSGGQQQRVALARALAPEPKMLLLDEPFSNLDSRLKRHLRSELFQIIRKSKVTALFLTHDTQDAMAVSDRVVVLQNGRVIQEGTPKELYENPINRYIAALFGPIVEFNEEDLAYFGFKANAKKKYAIRQHAFENGNTKLKYTAQVSVLESTYLGDYYLTLAVLPNKKTIQFTASTKLENTLLIGFDQHSVLSF